MSSKFNQIILISKNPKSIYFSTNFERKQRNNKEKRKQRKKKTRKITYPVILVNKWESAS